MENKFIVYILIAIGYYLYNRFQKLQEEANNRKVVIEKSVTQNQKVTKKELIETIIKKPVRGKTFDLSIPKSSYANKVQPVQNIPVLAFNELLSDKNFNSTNAPRIENQTEANDILNVSYLNPEFLDLKRMVIYSEVLSKPAYLKY